MILAVSAYTYQQKLCTVYSHISCSYKHNANLNIQILIITSDELPCEFQDGVTILLLTTDQEPILTFINRGKVAINDKAILQYSIMIKY